MTTDNDLQPLPSRRTATGERWRDLYATPFGAIPTAQLALDLPPTPGRTPNRGEQQQLRNVRLVLRAAAVASLGEAEWVRRVRASGVSLTPVQDPLRRVTRYQAQWRDPHASRLGREFLDLDLGTDLLLDELRATWAEGRSGPAEAAVEWCSHWPRFGRESVPVSDPALWARALGDVGAFNVAIRRLPAFDRDGWAWAAGRVAGMLAIWSLRAETEPAVFADASDELAASAARRGGRRRPWIGGRAAPDLGRAAYLLTQIRADARDAVCEQLLLRQLIDAATSIGEAHHARGSSARTRAIHTTVVMALAQRLYPAPNAGSTRREPEAR